MASDIFPTAWFGARLAEIKDGDVVAIFGAGPVGQLAVLSARMQGAGRVLIVDGNADRLETARLQNAETIDFNTEDPVATIRELTGGIGAGRSSTRSYPSRSRAAHRARSRRRARSGSSACTRCSTRASPSARP